MNDRDKLEYIGFGNILCDESYDESPEKNLDYIFKLDSIVTYILDLSFGKLIYCG